MPRPTSPEGSLKLVEQYFAAADDRFLDALRALGNPAELAGVVDRWKRDPRPWARQQIIAYLQMPLDRAGHQVVVKRLFKWAEEQQDHQLMGSFLVAFDRLVRRRRRTRYRYDWRTGQSWQEERLVTPGNVLPAKAHSTLQHPRTGKTTTVRNYSAVGDLLFSYRTRYYLRRRAWRYFRQLAHRDPEDCRRHLAAALAQYTDADLGAGEHVLECWGLLHACFARHPALEFGDTRIRLKPGGSLGQLSPAPYMPSAWQGPDAVDDLLRLVIAAKSRLVREWAMELFRQQSDQHLDQVTVDRLLQLFAHERESVQEFAAELLHKLPQVARLSIDQWLRLLEVQQPTALTVICDTMQRYVQTEQFTLDQCLDLACATTTPVARLGFGFVRSKQAAKQTSPESLVRLAHARCQALGGEIASWALGIVGTAEAYQLDPCLEFLDSRNPAVREAAWQWLTSPSAGYDDPLLFTRLLETPYDDIRFHLIDDLTRRASLPLADQGDLTPLWAAVLLSVHRGSRVKRQAIAQLADFVADDPRQAETLLPVLCIALRSVRAPELRAGLAAVVSLTERRPELATVIQQHLPELELATEEAETWN